MKLVDGVWMTDAEVAAELSELEEKRAILQALMDSLPDDTGEDQPLVNNLPDENAAE